MKRMFEAFKLSDLELVNRFVFPPIKLGRGNPDGTVTDRQLTFYQQISRSGPGVVIIEPVSVTADGREHPKQPCVHLSESVEMEKYGESLSLEPFQSVILASGMRSAPEPNDEIKKLIANIEIIGDADKVQDTFTAVRAGYELACKY